MKAKSMSKHSPEEVTQMLLDWSDGNKEALDRLMPLIYDELRRLARHYMRRERRGHTLQTTALVNEAYMRLIDQRSVQWQNRVHFFSVAARMMRRILIDYARSRQVAKREGELRKVSIDEAATIAHEPDASLIAIDDALTSLEALDPRKVQVIELRFFGGLTIDETAAALNTSHATIERDWTTARAWLYREVSRSELSGV